LDRFIRNNYASTAQLKELMTAPPMTAEQHAAINRKRIEQRRMNRLETEFAERIKQGSDPQDLMRQFFNRANRRGLTKC